MTTETEEPDEEERARRSGPEAYLAWLTGFRDARELREAWARQRHARALNPVRNRRKPVPPSRDVAGGEE